MIVLVVFACRGHTNCGTESGLLQRFILITHWRQSFNVLLLLDMPSYAFIDIFKLKELKAKGWYILSVGGPFWAAHC